MTANDSQPRERIPAPATRPRSGAEIGFGRVSVSTSPPGARTGPATAVGFTRGVAEPVRADVSAAGKRHSRAATLPDRPGRTGRVAGPFAALSLRSELLLVGRSAPPPGLIPRGQEFLHLCGPYLSARPLGRCRRARRQREHPTASRPSTTARPPAVRHTGGTHRGFHRVQRPAGSLTPPGETFARMRLSPLPFCADGRGGP